MALTFAPSGAYLAAGLRDGSIVFLPVDKPFPGAASDTKLSKEELESCWTNLADQNAAKAHQALAILVAAPMDSVPLLQRKIQPAPVAHLARIQQWILDLDSTKFAVRQAAVKELEKAGTQAEAPVQKALAGNLSLEARLRLEKVAHTLAESPGPDALRNMRAIMALERIGSPEARRVLETLAAGAPGASTTEEAKASLARFARRAR